MVFEGWLTGADTLEAGAPPTALKFGSDGNSLYLALHAGDGSELIRVGRVTGGVLQRRRFQGDSITGLWMLSNGRTIVGATPNALLFIPADLSHAGKRIDICDDSVTAFTPSGGQERAYAVCGEATLIEIDSKLEIAIRSASVPADTGGGEPCGTAGVATSPSGSVIYVLCREAGKLVYIDRLTLQVFGVADVGADARDLAVSPGGKIAVITRPDADELVVLRVRRREILSRIHVKSAWSVVIGMDERTAYVTTYEGQHPSQLLRIDLDEAIVAARAATLPGSTEVTIWPDGKSPRMWWD